jgi:transcription elongation factor GreA
MPEKEVLLTAEGIKELQEELHCLKTVKRPAVSNRIKVAIGFGDISENAEYDDAKNEQAFIEGRILTINRMLGNARIIDTEKASDDTICIGATVLLRDLEFGEDQKYTIVGATESNPDANKISNESLVGKAILGQKIGTIVTVNAPIGPLQYKILGIHKKS